MGSAIENLRMGRIDHIDHYRLLTNATRLSLVYEYDKLLSISNSKMVPELRAHGREESDGIPRRRGSSSLTTSALERPSRPASSCRS